MKTKNYINELCHALKLLHKQYPSQNMGRHLDAALADYRSLFGVSDKELSYALSRYITTLELDPIATEAEVERIIREGSNLDTILQDDYDEEEDY
jgi:hypothetical protein